jgi:hypothetical protein
MNCQFQDRAFLKCMLYEIQRSVVMCLTPGLRTVRDVIRHVEEDTARRVGRLHSKVKMSFCHTAHAQCGSGSAVRWPVSCVPRTCVPRLCRVASRANFIFKELGWFYAGVQHL